MNTTLRRPAIRSIFALCHLLGFRFAPRIRDLGSHRLYTFNKVPVNHPLAPVIGGRIRVDTIWRNWDVVLRQIASLRRGTASPSLLVSKLAAYPKQTDLALALREIGRLERTIFTLDWLKDPGLRRRVHLGLNKGEAQNSLKRSIRFHRRGSLIDRSTPDLELSAGALNLVAAAITLWNTVYLNNAISFLAKSEAPVPPICVPHISPLGWEHITLTGIYTWNQNYTGRLDRLRPLRIRSDHNLSSWPA